MTAVIRATSRTDQFAKCFIPAPMRLLSRFSGFQKILETRLPENTYNNVVARTKFIDHILQSQNFDQVVILGAGFDSRFLRFSNHHTKFFEIDHPATQSRKLEILRKKHLLEDSHRVFFISFDINQQRINNQTLTNDFSPQVPTLFIAEGLTMYLSESSINQLFQSLANFSSLNNEIVFDYINQKNVEDHNSSAQQVVTQLGEQWTFGIDSPDTFLQKHRLQLISLRSLSNGGIIHAKL